MCTLFLLVGQELYMIPDCQLNQRLLVSSAVVCSITVN